jgi:non-ribosomal peptide synthase protein (TIGR01720 family)
LTQEIDVPVLDRALEEVHRQHDAFRLRFCLGDKAWQQTYSDEPGLVRVRSYPAEDQDRAVRETHLGLNLERGPVLRAAVIESEPRRLLLVAHHLVIDAVSWRIVLEDLAMVASQLASGKPIQLLPVATTYQQWADWVARHVRVIEPTRATPRLPRDFHTATTPLESSSTYFEATLSAEETVALEHDLFRKAGIEAVHLSLAALAFSLSTWSGSETIAVDWEGHGRDLTPGMDVSRTVGWFTRFQRLAIRSSNNMDPFVLVAAVRREVDRVRRSPMVQAHQGAEVSFNYLGKLDHATATDGPFRLIRETVGELHDPQADRPHVLAVEIAEVNGCLRTVWSFSRDLHRQETLKRLAETYTKALRTLGWRARYADARRPTPLNFPRADVLSEELDRLLEIDSNPEEIYPATPAQQGILFHALYGADSSVYLNQFYWKFRGDLRLSAYRQAWGVTIARHPALRTSFVHHGVRELHQVVHRDSDVSLDVLDWRSLTKEDQETNWRHLLRSERARPLDPFHGPLMRLAIAQLREDEWRLLWNHHHVIFDGWCTGLILRDVFTAYEALVRGSDPEAVLLPRPRPFSDYVRWLSEKDLFAAEDFWRNYLDKLQAPPSLLPGQRREVGNDESVTRPIMDHRLDERLRQWQASRGLTPNTCVLGAWSLVLSKRLGCREVVVGSTVSGRPIDLDGAEEIVGLFINTLPVRVRVEPHMRVVDWLHELQRRQARILDHQHVSLWQIRRWSGLPARQPLFETAVVFENLPQQSVSRRPPVGLGLSDVGSFVRNDFPFTIRAAPGPPLSIEALYDPVHFSLQDADRLLATLVSVLDRILDNPLNLLKTLDVADNPFMCEQT